MDENKVFYWSGNYNPLIKWLILFFSLIITISYALIIDNFKNIEWTIIISSIVVLFVFVLNNRRNITCIEMSGNSLKIMYYNYIFKKKQIVIDISRIHQVRIVNNIWKLNLIIYVKNNGKFESKRFGYSHSKRKIYRFISALLKCEIVVDYPRQWKKLGVLK